MEPFSKLFIDDLFVQLIQLVHELTLIVLDIVGPGHNFLDLILVSHQVSQVVLHIFKFI